MTVKRIIKSAECNTFFDSAGPCIGYHFQKYIFFVCYYGFLSSLDEANDRKPPWVVLIRLCV